MKKIVNVFVCKKCGLANSSAECSNCGRILSEADSRELSLEHCLYCDYPPVSSDEVFCRKCGRKLGEGIIKEFLPDQDYFQCVYGPPPVNRLHKCENCGFEWNNCYMIDCEKFCPVCGSEVSVTETDNQARFR